MTRKKNIGIITVCLMTSVVLGTLVGCTPETPSINSPVSVTETSSETVTTLSPEGAAAFINDYYQKLNNIPSSELDEADKTIREAIKDDGVTTQQTKNIVLKHTPLLNQYHGIDDMRATDIITLSQQIFQQAYQSKTTNNQKLKIAPDAVTAEEIIFDIQSNSATYKSPLFDVAMEVNYQDGEWLMNPESLLERFEKTIPSQGK